MNDNKKEVLVSMKHVNIGFKSGTKVRVVIDDLNLDVYKGEILGLVGESGSGQLLELFLHYRELSYIKELKLMVKSLIN